MDKEIRIIADSEMLERIEMLKDHHGIKSNADLVRFLISQEYHALIKEKKPK